MHLDVSRHFFPKEFIKKYIDLIALHKMNIFHWHLTDDNGWRIETDQYPLLTEVAAWRADREGIPWNECQPQRPGEPAKYGGFYTKEDIREIVEYAKQRFITVIPEIEMPGHSSEVFAAYPEYSCSGKKLTVQTGSYWPNTDIFCAGKEGSFRFLENVLAEVIELFPSEYIHIGGDEADKTAWKACPDCQSRIRNEGLHGVDELQSYFVKRIEKYLHSKGKRLIGWDEILEGGIAPDATVMSWRGFEGGIEAARQGHQVVMCPTSHCYFDYYQADPEFQPPGPGGLITVKKVYSFRPVPSELEGEQQRLILGGQGNLWTEYVPTASHAEYMALPRMTALAEVLWSPENKLDWEDFRSRLQTQFSRFELFNVNYSHGSGKVEAIAVFDQEDIPLAIKLQTEVPGTSIYYSMNGNKPDKNSFKYKYPIIIDDDLTLKAIAYLNDAPLEKFAEYKITNHNMLGKSIHYKENFSERYPAGGRNALNDGLRGSLNYNDGYWQGFNGKNVDVIIDLGDNFVFNSVTSTFLLDQKKWIFIPDVVNYYISQDGQNFQQLGSLTHKIPLNSENPVTNDFSIKLNKPMKIRSLRLEAVNMGVCPDWHPGKGQKAWIFLDEIVVK
jgi:hexosaminidase